MRAELIAFVRGTLGCGCPDEVFEDMRVERRPEPFAGLPVDALVRIGGRLVVALCSPTDRHQIEAALARIVTVGVTTRDAEGFNRLRVVVVTADDAAGPVLATLFAAATGGDKRAFLHVVAPSAVPADLRAHPHC